MCERCVQVRVEQEESIRNLQSDLEKMVAEGNDYYAYLIQDEIQVQQSSARLIHKAPYLQTWERNHVGDL